MRVPENPAPRSANRSGGVLVLAEWLSSARPSHIAAGCAIDGGQPGVIHQQKCCDADNEDATIR